MKCAITLTSANSPENAQSTEIKENISDIFSYLLQWGEYFLTTKHASCFLYILGIFRKEMHKTVASGRLGFAFIYWQSDFM